MKIVLFGGDGQVGKEVLTRSELLNFEVRSPSIEEVDITEADQVNAYMDVVSPEVVINLAAYTAVDRAEEEQNLAFTINGEGAGNIARASAKIHARMIHVSTDYVFPGTGSKPLKEEDPADPPNVYGASKLEGEKQVREALHDRVLIVRTSSVHGQYGENFVHTMKQLFCSREEVSVVHDQIMSPTWAGWLAEVLLDLVRTNVGGVVHACSGFAISWYDFAEEIYLQLKLAECEGLKEVKLVPVPATRFPRPARRPAYSVMDTSRLTAILGRPPLDWKSGLKGHLQDLGVKKQES